MRSFFFCDRLRAVRVWGNHVVSTFAAVALLLGPGVLHAQTISYAGIQTVFPVTGVTAPAGIAIDGAGNRYILDNAAPNITEVSASGVRSTINSTLSSPIGIAVDIAGTNLYVADTGNNRVLKIPIAGGSQTTVGSGLSQPNGVAIDGLGNIYIVDNGHSRVLQIAAVGGAQTSIAASSLSTPEAVAVDSYNNVYIVDIGDNSLVKVTAAGAVSYAQNNSLIAPPIGVAVDRFGNIFVASESGHLTMYGGGGLVRALGTGFTFPIGPATDSSGNVYVADPVAGHIDIVAPGAVDMGQANVCPSSGTQTPPCSQSVTLDFNILGGNQNISSVAVKVSTQREYLRNWRVQHSHFPRARPNSRPFTFTVSPARR